MRLSPTAGPVGAAAALALAVAGCTLPWRRPAVAPQTAAEALLAHADAEADAGHARTACALYEEVVREHPDSPAAGEALHGLVVLRLDPDSAARDRRGALEALGRLGAPERGRWAAEARAWRALLRRLARCEALAARRGADAQRLRETLDSLQDSDPDLEQEP